MTIEEPQGEPAQSGHTVITIPQSMTRKPKLTGRAFWNSIGAPKKIVAPMVAQSELSWRLLTRKFSDPDAKSKDILAYSPMMHSRLFAEENTKYAIRALPPLQDGVVPQDRPLTVQFCSNSPQNFVKAASLVQDRCDAVDLNLGCPQGIARKGRYGSFLQDEWELIQSMISLASKELSVPVTAKIRIFPDRQRTLDYARMILSAGASILTVHGRTRDQKGQNTGLADWETIRYLRDNLPADTVLVANGNILTHSDVDACLLATGADAVMSAEANLGNPAIFLPAEAAWEHRFPRVDVVMRAYLDIVRDQCLYSHPEQQAQLLADGRDPQTGGKLSEKEVASLATPITNPCFQGIKSHLFSLLRYLIAQRTDIRDTIARTGGHRTTSMEPWYEILSLVEAAVEEAANGEVIPTREEEGNWREQVPWWRCKSYVRPLPEEARAKGGLRDKLSKSEKKRKALEEAEKMVNAEKRVCVDLDEKVAG